MLYRVLHSDADLSGCPERLRELLNRCLAKDPAERPAPAEVIAYCRSRIAGQTGEIVQPWLPPAIVAVLAQHVPPPPPIATPATVTATKAIPGNGGIPSGEPPLQASPALGPGVGLGRRDRRPVILGGSLAVVGMAALLAAGLLTLNIHSGTSSGPHHSLAVLGARTSKLTSATPRPSSPREPRTPPTLDACLVGTWTDIADDLINTIDNHPVQFTGHGGYLIVRADGSGFVAFGPETMTATFNGNKWTDVIDGSVTMHVDTGGGAMLFSDVVPSKNATQTLYENGVFNNAAPTTLEPGPQRYACSGNTLRVFTNVGSGVYTRKPPTRQATAPAGS